MSVGNKVSGIYMIRNKVNHKTYVGRSHDITERLAGHIKQLISGKHSNSHLLDDFKKFGISNFSFEILEIVDFNIPNINSYLAGLEEKYALRYNALYPDGYCKRIADLHSSSERLREDSIICYDVRTDEEKVAESFGEAAAMTGIKAGKVKKVISSSTNYAKHYLFFFESDYKRMDPAILEQKKIFGLRYSIRSNQEYTPQEEFEMNEGGRRPYDFD